MNDPVMKRYASHYLFYSDQIYSKYVVELEGMSVSRIFPLSGELESTYWLDGVVVLSLSPDFILRENVSFSDLLILLSKDVFIGKDGNPAVVSPVYAYHIAPLDMSSFSLLPESGLRRLD